MGQPYCTGPCAAFVGTGIAGAPDFLGYSESGFEIDTQASYEPFICDLGGTQTPLDMQDMGEQAIISGTLKWWSELVFAKVSVLKNSGDPLGAPSGATWGTRKFGSVGAFQGAEARACVLWLQYPYSAKPAMQSVLAGPMEKGRRYPFAMLRVNRETTGTSAKRRVIAFHCLPSFNVKTLDAVLFDNNISALPNAVVA